MWASLRDPRTQRLVKRGLESEDLLTSSDKRGRDVVKVRQIQRVERSPKLGADEALVRVTIHPTALVVELLSLRIADVIEEAIGEFIKSSPCRGEETLGKLPVFDFDFEFEQDGASSCLSLLKGHISTVVPVRRLGRAKPIF